MLPRVCRVSLSKTPLPVQRPVQGGRLHNGLKVNEATISDHKWGYAWHCVTLLATRRWLRTRKSTSASNRELTWPLPCGGWERLHWTLGCDQTLVSVGFSRDFLRLAGLSPGCQRQSKAAIVVQFSQSKNGWWGIVEVAHLLACLSEAAQLATWPKAAKRLVGGGSVITIARPLLLPISDGGRHVSSRPRYWFQSGLSFLNKTFSFPYHTSIRRTKMKKKLGVLVGTLLGLWAFLSLFGYAKETVRLISLIFMLRMSLQCLCVFVEYICIYIIIYI